MTNAPRSGDPAPDGPELVVLETPDELDTAQPTLGVRTFDAFREVNYRWFFAALCGNFASMNMQIMARSLLVLTLVVITSIFAT